jgi:hypothetical protein
VDQPIQQLTQQIVERTGVNQSVARTAIQYMGGFLKGKAPQHATQIDSFLGVQGATTPPELGQVKTLDQLTGFMSQRLNIPEGTAKSVVQVTGAFIKQKAPAPLNTQIETVLGQVKGGAGAWDSTKQMPGGMSQQEEQPQKR